MWTTLYAVEIDSRGRVIQLNLIRFVVLVLHRPVKRCAAIANMRMAHSLRGHVVGITIKKWNRANMYTTFKF